MANRKFKIENESDYNVLMKRIDALMKKGENSLSDNEAEKLRAMAPGGPGLRKNDL